MPAVLSANCLLEKDALLWEARERAQLELLESIHNSWHITSALSCDTNIGNPPALLKPLLQTQMLYHLFTKLSEKQ